MTSAHPLGAILGLSIIALVMMSAPVTDARNNERHASQQRIAKLEQNKKLFKKYYTDAEAMTFPVASYKDESK